jgi:hypothetical protein
MNKFNLDILNDRGGFEKVASGLNYFGIIG